jgi:hypothetical protein
MRLLADLFKGLKGVRENGESLLDRAMVLYGSNLGDANAHSITNMPVLLEVPKRRLLQRTARHRCRH